MGVVYKALDEKLRRLVALKLLGNRYLIDESQQSMPRYGTRRASGITQNRGHPASDTSTSAFIVMEYVEGESLRSRITRGPLLVEEAIAVGKQIADALAHAHAVGVVHRDLKPENVMLAREAASEDLLFLTEGGGEAEPSFGYSSSSAPTTSPAALAPTIPAASGETNGERIMGTPAYMAPEQMSGRNADARSDIFSFCVSLYEALYGERPFEGRSLDELRKNIISEKVKPSPSGTRVPAWLRAAVLRGLRARPEDRYSSMDAVMAALDRRRAPPEPRPWRGGILLAPAAPPPCPEVPWPRRRRSQLPSPSPPSRSGSRASATALRGRCSPVMAASCSA